VEVVASSWDVGGSLVLVVEVGDASDERCVLALWAESTATTLAGVITSLEALSHGASSSLPKVHAPGESLDLGPPRSDDGDALASLPFLKASSWRWIPVASLVALGFLAGVSRRLPQA
jgi:hypothetical protein